MTPDTNSNGPAPRVYPQPEPANGNDPRFTYGLVFDVADVLVAHGYPRPTGDDLVELHQALFRFIYLGRRP